MLDDIIYAAGCILMVVEAVALVFLIWAWRDAKRGEENETEEAV